MKPWSTSLVMILAIMNPSVVTAMEFRNGDNLNVRGRFTDNLFASGGQVNASPSSTDDVYIAGGDLLFDGTTSQALVMAGGNINITDARVRELIVAGGSIRFDGTQIQDDLIAAGGNLRVGSKTQVKGSTVLAGSAIALAGHFSGDVQVYADRLTIEPTAVIRGNLTHSSRDVLISPDARIQGQTIELPARRTWWRRDGGPGIFLGILFFLGALLIVPILVTMFPRITDKSRQLIQKRFWETLGKGTVTAILLPILWILLLVSVLGTPIGIVATPFLLALGVLAWSVAVGSFAEWLRESLIKKSGKSSPNRKQRFAWALLASLLLMLFLWVPILGILLAVLVYLSGLGALYSQAMETKR